MTRDTHDRGSVSSFEHYGISLDDHDRAMLSGDEGPGAALAMRVLLSTARAMGATELIDVANAHVDGCIYIGSVSIDFAQALVDGGARVRVPTTLNVGAIDLLHPDQWNGDAELAENGRRLMELYKALGCVPTWTCAPYQLLGRPEFGQNVAWGESNAIVFANSVLGARTQRYGDFVDIAAAIVGKAPRAGLHLDDGRFGDISIDVSDLPGDVLNRDSLFPLLGHLVGQWCGGRMPVVSGISTATEDQLKAFGAACASTGATAMFHVVGVTPEAPTRKAAFGGREPMAEYRVNLTDLERAWSELCTKSGGALGAVCLGTPHYSVDECRTLLRLLNGRTVHADSPLYVSTGRFVLAELERAGVASELRTCGVRFVTDTCTYNSPVLGELDGLVMTTSAKWAWYAPRNVGVDVLFAELDNCVESAVEGRIIGAGPF